MADEENEGQGAEDPQKQDKAPFSLPKRTAAQTGLYIAMLLTITAVGVGVYTDEEVTGPRYCRKLIETFGGAVKAPGSWNPSWEPWVTVMGYMPKEPEKFLPFYGRLDQLTQYLPKTLRESLNTEPQEASTSMACFQPPLLYGPVPQSVPQYDRDRQIKSWSEWAQWMGESVAEQLFLDEITLKAYTTAWGNEKSEKKGNTKLDPRQQFLGSIPLKEGNIFRIGGMYIRQQRFNNTNNKFNQHPYWTAIRGRKFRQYYTDSPTYGAISMDIQGNAVNSAGYTLSVPFPWPDGPVPVYRTMQDRRDRTMGLTGLNITSTVAAEMFRSLVPPRGSSPKDNSYWIQNNRTSAVTVDFLLYEHGSSSEYSPIGCRFIGVNDLITGDFETGGYCTKYYNWDVATMISLGFMILACLGSIGEFIRNHGVFGTFRDMMVLYNIVIVTFLIVFMVLTISTGALLNAFYMNVILLNPKDARALTMWETVGFIDGLLLNEIAKQWLGLSILCLYLMLPSFLVVIPLTQLPLATFIFAGVPMISLIILLLLYCFCMGMAMQSLYGGLTPDLATPYRSFFFVCTEMVYDRFQVLHDSGSDGIGYVKEMERKVVAFAHIFYGSILG